MGKIMKRLRLARKKAKRFIKDKIKEADGSVEQCLPALEEAVKSKLREELYNQFEVQSKIGFSKQENTKAKKKKPEKTSLLNGGPQFGKGIKPAKPVTKKEFKDFLDGLENAFQDVVSVEFISANNSKHKKEGYVKVFLTMEFTQKCERFGVFPGAFVPSTAEKFMSKKMKFNIGKGKPRVNTQIYN